MLIVFLSSWELYGHVISNMFMKVYFNCFSCKFRFFKRLFSFNIFDFTWLKLVTLNILYHLLTFSKRFFLKYAMWNLMTLATEPFTSLQMKKTDIK